MALTQVSSAGIKNAEVKTEDILDANVTTAKIAADAITGAKIADDTIDSEHYAAGSIDAEHIAASAINDGKISNGAVITAKVADNAITGAKVADNLDIPDNNKIRFGTGNDLELFHDGSNSYIKDVGTGALVLATSKLSVNNAASNEELIVAYQNGSVELFYDNSKKLETTSAGVKASGNVDLDDSNKVRLGDAGDLSIWHDGSHSYLTNTTGSLRIVGTAGADVTIRNGDDTANVAVFNIDGSTHLYHDSSHKFSTTSSGVDIIGNATISGAINTSDNQNINIGNGGDLKIYHDGTINRIRSNVQIVIEKTDSEDIATFIPDGAVSLFYDGSKKFETVTGGATITGVCTATSFAGDGSNLTGVSSVGGSTGVDFNDSVKVRLGTGNDLEIYHNGSDSYIDETGAGDLKIRSSSGIQLQKSSEKYIACIPDGQVELYHDNAKKFQTVSYGAQILHDGNAQLNIRDTTATAVAAYITASTAGKAEYNCYKEGVGTKYPHVFVGYTTEYARIDDAGIKFNGDTATANAISDYEEGTWTPTWSGGSNFNYDGNNSNGEYVKIGNLVHIRCFIGFGNPAFTSGGQSWDLVVGGLPYAPSVAGYGTGVISVRCNSLGSTVTGSYILGLVSSSAATINLKIASGTNNPADTNLTAAAIGNYSSFSVQGTYHTTGL